MSFGLSLLIFFLFSSDTYICIYIVINVMTCDDENGNIVNTRQHSENRIEFKKTNKLSMLHTSITATVIKKHTESVFVSSH